MATPTFDKARKVAVTDGLFGLLGKSVMWLGGVVGPTLRNLWKRSVRKTLPQSGFQTYNGIKIQGRYVGDQITGVLRDKPEYEGNYVDLIRQHVREGDDVVVVGGWHGVSAVAAAKTVGEAGKVTVFEATTKGAKRVARVSRLNGVSDTVEVKNRIVGESVTDIKGGETARNCADPSDFGNCDVLALDCDGCELGVLEQLECRPRKVIVEHHGEGDDGGELKFRYDEQRLRSVLESKAYEVSTFEVRNRVRYGHDDKIGWFYAEDIG